MLLWCRLAIFNRWPRVPGSACTLITSQITALGFLLGLKDIHHRSEETWLQMARTLLRLGASVNSEISLWFPTGIVNLNLVEYCVRFETAPFLRLLLQHDALEQWSPHDQALIEYFALLRGDKEIIQALEDHGVAFQQNSPRRPETLQAALFCASHTAGVSLGRPFTHLFQLGELGHSRIPSGPPRRDERLLINVYDPAVGMYSKRD